MLLRDLNAKVGKEHIFKPTADKESLQETSELCHIQKSECQKYISTS
jgi:hypothetical protein